MPPKAGPSKPVAPRSTIRETIHKYIWSHFEKKDPRKPIKGFLPRIQNIVVNNYSGIVGVIVPFIGIMVFANKGDFAQTVTLMWLTMLWFYILQPVAVPVVGLIPIFALPMFGVMGSVATCGAYMNENTILFILTAMLLVLLNNSGIDKRVALWFICSGDACQYSGKRMVLKLSSAAFFMSMFSSRLIATALLIQYVSPAYTQLQAKKPKNNPDYPNFEEMRCIVINAIHTASAIGSLAIIHGAPATVLFRGAFNEIPPAAQEYPDIFNYLQYSAFAFPLAFVMFILNTVYHMYLINWYIGPAMINANMSELRTMLVKVRADNIPRVCSLHERLSVISCIILYGMLFFRWNQWISGWGDYSANENAPTVPGIKDATTASIFLILLHSMPKGFGFTKFLDVQKRSDLPPLKPESSILWWRFVDRNVNYGYFFTMGSCFALVHACRKTGLDMRISENIGKLITSKSWNAGIFLVIFITTILSNIMTSMASCGIFIPFAMAMAKDAPLPWPTKAYLVSLAVGIASSFSFLLPFKYTPAYYCHFVGKVPVKKMIKYSFLSLWICMICLWIALMYWAPYLFDPDDHGFEPLDVKATKPPADAVTIPTSEGP